MTSRLSPWWLYGFVVLQLVLQTALMIPGIGGVRTVLRAMTFGSSIAMLLLPGRGRYPLASLILIIFGLVTLGLFHPGLNTPLAGMAQIGMYIAIWGPVFWVTRIAVTPNVFANVILLLWAFHAVSAGVGVLQVYYPERFAPEPAFVKELGGANAEGLMIEVADGKKVFRPFGLSDGPGGAAVSGSFAVLVGLILIGVRKWSWSFLGIASVSVGLFSIYLSHIRSLLVVTGVSVGGLVGILAVRGQVGRAVIIAVAAVVFSVSVFVWAASVGKSVTERFATLLEDSPGEVYHSNRGIFLMDTLEDKLPKYPLGAGLGRWGMMNAYFGTNDNPDSPTIWVEIQPAAWVVDGGVLLLIGGYAAVIGALALSAHLALRVRNNSLAVLAAIVAAFNLSILVNTAGYCSFISQTGMMFWVLNAALYTACTSGERRL